MYDNIFCRPDYEETVADGMYDYDDIDVDGGHPTGTLSIC